MYTLLIADDEADERTLIRFLLNDFRNTFHILEAQNGRDALELLTNNHVDIRYPNAFPKRNRTCQSGEREES